MKGSAGRIFSGSVARGIVEALAALRVTRVFGLPALQLLELFDELADAPFETVTPADERSAAFMADAHARLTCGVGVLVVTGGPGLTNALTGIAEALLDSSPVLVIVGGKNRLLNKKFQLHDIEQERMLEPLVKRLFQPASGEEAVRAICEGAALALAGEPGPVAVIIPADLMTAAGSFPMPENRGTLAAVDPGKLELVAEMLRRSRSVGIYAGAGAFGASSELEALAELLQSPVATTISGRGVIPEDHPLSVGCGFGRSAAPVARRAFGRIDTLLAVGCKYSEPATGCYGITVPKTHIHIDINPTTLGTNYPATLAIEGDAGLAVARLVELLKDAPRPENTKLTQAFMVAKECREREILHAPLCANAVTPPRLLRLLRHRLDRDAVMVTDCGTHQFWTLSDFSVLSPRSFLTPADFQAMGFAIPSAIAAKRALPDRQVIALVGDGCFLMNGMECLVAQKIGVPLKVIVFRDGAWGLVRDAQRRGYLRTPFTEIPNPDYQLLAASFGMKHVLIGSDREIEGGIADMLSDDTSCLVEARVSYTKAPPYVDGAAAQIFRTMPFSRKFSVGGRLAMRIFRKR